MATEGETENEHDLTSMESDGCAACCGIEPIIDVVAIENALKEQEIKLRDEFKLQVEQEIEYMKDKFDFILQNEQVRASHMLREAHRERSEKIGALKTQLECKNLAGLMYVLCLERRKSRLERMRIIEEYTGYIRALQDILSEGQDLILHLSRGYKTAARVDYEWKQKMLKVIYQFQNFVCDFTGGTKEDIQHFFDLPNLCKICSPTKDNENEDPCENYEDEVLPEYEEEKSWWEKLEDDDKCRRPFVMFGDMSEFKPLQRRAVLKTVKAAKTAPKRWKEYVFNEMFLRRDCANTDEIKHEYPKHLPSPTKWECEGVQTMNESDTNPGSRRVTGTSIDIRGNMGSILKIITTSGFQNMDKSVTAKSTLLAARDSMEIASSTKLLRHKDSSVSGEGQYQLDTQSITHKSAASTIERPQESTIQKPQMSTIEGPQMSTIEGPQMSTIEGPQMSNVEGPQMSTIEGPQQSTIDGPRTSTISGRKTPTIELKEASEIEFPQKSTIERPEKSTIEGPQLSKIAKSQKSMIGRPSLKSKLDMEPRESRLDGTEEDEDAKSKSKLGNCILDSLHLMQDRVKDHDYKINTEKVCPMEECQRMQMDSFLRKLPPYMRASPFLHFEQTFDNYEPCSPEQLEILKQRIEEKAKGHRESVMDPLDEWVSPVEGVGVQTSMDNILPPCTCQLPAPESRDSSQIMIYKLQDLFPVKDTLDLVRKECFFDDTIQLDRFKVVGQQDTSKEKMREAVRKPEEKGDFQSRLFEVRKVLNQHPSLCSLFQANTSC